MDMLRGMTPEQLLEFQQKMKNDFDAFSQNVRSYENQSEDSLIGTGKSR
jgi:hypothetical protein